VTKGLGFGASSWQAVKATIDRDTTKINAINFLTHYAS